MTTGDDRSGHGFAAALAQGPPLVLDGGLAQCLTDQGADTDGPLWSARALADEPGQLVAAHRAFLEAGARVLISASYQASVDGFLRHGLDRATADDLAARSVRLARAAGRRSAVRGTVWVAGSVGPYGAVCADGGEYRGAYGLGVARLAAFHQPRIEAVLAGAPDVLALETVPDIIEAEALLRAVDAAGGRVPVWLSYTVAGGRTRAGQPLEEAFAVAAGHPRVAAVGVNCCAPHEVTGAVERAVAATGLPAVAYPNSGEGWDPRARAWRGGTTFDPRRAAEWAAAGARLVGGCCRVGPTEIAALARSVAAGPGHGAR